MQGTAERAVFVLARGPEWGVSLRDLLAERVLSQGEKRGGEEQREPAGSAGGGFPAASPQLSLLQSLFSESGKLGCWLRTMGRHLRSSGRRCMLSTQ